MSSHGRVRVLNASHGFAAVQWFGGSGFDRFCDVARGHGTTWLRVRGWWEGSIAAVSDLVGTLRREGFDVELDDDAARALERFASDSFHNARRLGVPHGR